MSLDTISFYPRQPSAHDHSSNDSNQELIDILHPGETIVSKVSNVNIFLDPILRFGQKHNSKNTDSSPYQASTFSFDSASSIEKQIPEDVPDPIPNTVTSSSSSKIADQAQKEADAMAFAEAICNATSYKVNGGTLVLTDERIIFVSAERSASTSSTTGLREPKFDDGLPVTKKLDSLEIPKNNIILGKIYKPFFGKAHWRGQFKQSIIPLILLVNPLVNPSKI